MNHPKKPQTQDEENIRFKTTTMENPAEGQLRYNGGPIHGRPVYVQPPYNMRIGNQNSSTARSVFQSLPPNDPPPPYSQSLSNRPEAPPFMSAAVPAPRRDRFIPIFSVRSFPPPELEIGLNFNIGVLQVSGFGADVRPKDIAMILGDEVPMLDIGYSSGIPAIHILQDRCTGRTLDAYVEYATLDHAMQVLKNFDARASRGRDIKLGIYRPKVALTSMTEMMKAIFARADCRWGNGLPEYQIPVYLGFFGGFILKEELHRMLNLAQHPSNPRNFAARECPDRVYHFAISSLARVPWNAQTRDHWFSEAWLQKLVETYEKMAIKLAHEIRDQHYLRLDIKLLTHFMYALRHSPLLCRTQAGIERFNVIANRVDGILSPIAFINPTERLAAALQRGAVDSPAFDELQNIGKRRESVLSPFTPTGPAAGNYGRLMHTSTSLSPTPYAQQKTPVHARAFAGTPIPRGPAAMYKALNNNDNNRPGSMPVYPTNHLHGLYPRQSPIPAVSPAVVSSVALPVALSNAPTPCRSPDCDRAHLAKLTYPLLSKQTNEYSQLKPTELVPPVKYLPTSIEDELQAVHRLSDPFQVNDWRSRAMTIANPVQPPQPNSSPEWARVSISMNNFTVQTPEDSDDDKSELEGKPVRGHRPAASFSGWQVDKKWKKKKSPKANRAQDNRVKFLAEMSDIEEANSSSGYPSSDDDGGGVALGGLEKFPDFDPEYGVEKEY